jgi:hypothetical protein
MVGVERDKEIKEEFGRNRLIWIGVNRFCGVKKCISDTLMSGIWELSKSVSPSSSNI